MKRPVLVTVLLFLFLSASAACGQAPTAMPSRPVVTPSPEATKRIVVTLETTVTPTPLPSTTPLPELKTPLVWLLRGDAPADLHRVNAALNALLEERGFRASVALRTVDSLGYERAVEQAFAEEQVFDLVSLSPAQYLLLAEAGRLLPINAYENPGTGRAENLLESQFMALKNAVPGYAWSAVEYTSTVYGVPNQPAWVRPRGVAIRRDIVDVLNLAERLEAAQSYADLSPLFAEINTAIRAGRLKEAGLAGEETPRRVFALADLLHPHNAGFDPLAMPFVVRFDDPQAQVYNWYATAEFRSLAVLRREWQMAGYAPESPLDPDQVRQGYREGQFAALVGVPLGPGSEAELHNQYGFDWVVRPVAPAFVPAQLPDLSLTAVNTSIAGDAERVRRALLLLELVNTDPRVNNLLVYGMEGEHWAWTDQEQQKIQPLAGGARYQPDFAGQIGNGMLSYCLERERDMCEQVGQSNQAAPVSPAVGFAFDPRPVFGEWAGMQGMTYEWTDALLHGQAEDVDKAIQRLLKKFDETGLPAVEAEVRRQFSQ